MDRRDFLKRGTAAAMAAGWSGQTMAKDAANPIPRRALGKTGEQLSIFGFSGTAVMEIEQADANQLVSEAFDRGVNYYDVAPTYGNAQDRLGPALEPYRKRCFLACKTQKRDRAGAEAELDNSLKVLRTDHIDLYQFHAVTTKEDVDKILAPNGAMEAYQAARKAGKIRYMGFSAHSVEAALSLMDAAKFDTILFPINYVMVSKAGFGRQVIEHARGKGMGILALKAMARGKYAENLPQDRKTPKCWYEPTTLPEEAALAYRWTLSQPVTAALPPGNPAWFRLALDVAQNFRPLSADETQSLLARAGGAAPLFQLGGNG